MSSYIYNMIGGVHIEHPRLVARLDPIIITDTELGRTKHRFAARISIGEVLNAKTENERLAWSMLFVKSWALASGKTLTTEWCVQ